MKADQFIKDVLERYGRSFESALLPADIERGPIGKCFDWSAVQAARLYPKYGYVEGCAESPNGDMIYHAWLTDGEHAFDPTWLSFKNDGTEIPVPSEYFGIELPFTEVVKFMKATKYQGVLGNQWRAPMIVDAMLKELV